MDQNLVKDKVKFGPFLLLSISHHTFILNSYEILVFSDLSKATTMRMLYFYSVLTIMLIFFVQNNSCHTTYSTPHFTSTHYYSSFCYNY